MPRNGSGTESIPNSFSPSTTISSSAVNANFTDVAAEITNSLPRDGQAAMTAPLPLAAGTVSAPGLTFSADTDGGLYRIAGDNFGFAVAGAKVLDLSTTGLGVTGTLTATGGITGVLGAMPVGAVLDFTGTVAPTGWLMAYGQTVSRTTYATLFGVLSTNYNTGGEAGTDFRLPDLRGRVVAGKDNMGGVAASLLTDQSGGLNGIVLGDTGGAETHTLTSAQLAAHTHTGTTASDGSHTHSYNHSSFTLNWPNVAGGVNGGPTTSDTTGAGGTHTHTFTTDSSGSGSAHNNVQPTIILNKIIYAGV